MASSDASEAITLEIRDYIGIITINKPKRLNALSGKDYLKIAEYLDDLANHPDTYVTLIASTGHFFSAGADFTGVKNNDDAAEMSSREYWVKNFVSLILYFSHTFYTHPKILVAALNGPVIGISASLVASCDFVYAAPHTWLMTPFTSLGLSAEGAASRAFVARMGQGLANEALIMGKRIPVQDLLTARFVNKIFTEGGGDAQSGKGFDSHAFLAAVMKEIDVMLGKHLNRESILKIKGLLRKPELDQLDKATVSEAISGLKGFLKGVPQEEFRKLASGEKRHSKL